MSKLSKNFSLSEMTVSDTAERLGIDNNPDDEQLKNLTLLCERILQPLRDEIGIGIIISSGLRNDALNKAVKGSKTSDHCKGLAGDIKCITGNHKLLFDTIVNMELPFKQLIWEFGDDEQPKWVHVALDLNVEPKRQKLKAIKQDGKTKYLSL